MPPANGEDGNPKPQSQTIDGENKKSQRQVKVHRVDENVEDVERASKMRISTPTPANLGPAQLVHRSFHDADTVYPTILPSFGPSSVAQMNQNSSAKSSLCRRCSEINLDMLLSRSHKTQAGQAANELRPVPSWDIHSYALCSLLQSTLDPIWSTQAGKKVSLRTYSSNKMVDKLWSSISTNWLKVGYTGRYICFST